MARAGQGSRPHAACRDRGSGHWVGGDGHGGECNQSAKHDFKFAHELVQVFELTVDGSKSNISDFIEVL
jgi:hypothetical protein